TLAAWQQRLHTNQPERRDRYDQPGEPAWNVDFRKNQRRVADPQRENSAKARRSQLTPAGEISAAYGSHSQHQRPRNQESRRYQCEGRKCLQSYTNSEVRSAPEETYSRQR